MPDDDLPSTPAEPVAADVSKPNGINLPRTGISHLLVWTALTAALLAFAPSLKALRQADTSVVEKVGLTVEAMLAALSFGGVITYVVRNWRGIRFPTQPGEWLLLPYALMFVASQVQFLATPLTNFSNPNDAVANVYDPHSDFNRYLKFSFGALVLSSNWYLIIAFTMRRHRWWVSVALCAALTNAFTAMAVVPSLWSTFPSGIFLGGFAWKGIVVMSALGLLAVLFLSAWELRRWRELSGLHWAGAVCHLCFFGACLIVVIPLLQSYGSGWNF